MHDTPSPVENRHLHRSLGLLQATAMNMSNMIGVGPFLTIPLILAAMGGPQAMLGWILGALLAVCDGMVWAELASAVPSSGGTFEYLKVAYAGTRLGRLLPFLFIWQFILVRPAGNRLRHHRLRPVLDLSCCRCRRGRCNGWPWELPH